jgi:cytochrome c biogenesis protein CcmG, thiol:disulfide interchange protein DsbE
MSHQPEPQPETPQAKAPYPPYRPSPYLLIFLVMPVFAALIAVLITESGIVPTDAEPTPAIIYYTPFSLVGNSAPAFNLPTTSGPNISNADFKGRWLVLNFWATWCEPCVREMPLLNQLAASEVAVLAINREEPADVIAAFTQQYTIALPIALDEKRLANDAYGVLQLPVTFFIDPTGVVRYKHTGELSPELLDRYLAKMAEGQ